SASNAFPSRGQRALVAGIGILAEMGLAGLAMIVWAWAEPGLIRSIAFNVLLIGGVSTLLFNGNPLLRYAGYFVLSDWLGIPNLGPRGSRLLGHLAVTRLLGAKGLPEPVAADRGERRWLVGYACASFVYRIFVMVAIVAFVATKFFFVGLAIAAWGVVQ